MRSRKLAVLFVPLAISGCMTVKNEDPLVYIRLDGKRLNETTIVAAQYQADTAVCLGQLQQAQLGAPAIFSTAHGIVGALDVGIQNGQRQTALEQIATGCMAQRGYIQVPASTAEERREEFAKSRKS